MKDATRVALIVSLILGSFTLTALAIPPVLHYMDEYARFWGLY